MSERRPRRGGFGRGMAPTEKAKDFQGSMKKLMDIWKNTESACF